MAEFLFWVHLVIIAFAISTGFFLSLSIVVLLVLGHRLHIYLFDGCAFSHYQKHAGGLPKNLNFLQFTVKRLFKKNITASQGTCLGLFLSFLPLVIALAS